MLSRAVPGPARPIEVIVRLIETYPPAWRRYCGAPERDGCACMGCVRQPAPATVRGDPEYAEWPEPSDALTEEEVQLYWSSRQ